MTSAETSPPMSQLQVADAVLASLASRDFDGLAMTFEPDIVLRGLLPHGFHEWTGHDRVTAAFAHWFGRADEWELLSTTVGVHGPRLRLGWRARVRGGHFGDVPLVVEQHVYADAGPSGRIQTMAMLCSGFTREHLDV